ncbi:hypothetical protein SRHO_G00305050 [Serrasalmus rhombeus]
MKLIPVCDDLRLPNPECSASAPLPAAHRMHAQFPGRGGEIPEDENGSRKCERHCEEGGAGRRAGTEGEARLSTLQALGLTCSSAQTSLLDREKEKEFRLSPARQQLVKENLQGFLGTTIKP